MCHRGIEGHQQCGAFLDEANPSMAAAVHAARVAFGLAKPALEVQVVLWEIHVVPSHTQPWLKTRHHAAYVLPRRIITALALLPQGLKLRVTLVARAPVGITRGLDSSHVCHLLADGLLRCLHARQTSVDRAGQACASFMRTPPLCASRFRCSDARTSPKASAIRKPGGGSGPP
jgi:hypothetical protein